jgi:hypothetical protein
MKKLAFCFLIYEEIECEELWHEFLKGVNHSRFNIYIHYKDNKPLKYFERYKLERCIDTIYGEFSVVAATNVLLEEAYKDPENESMIFLSGHCVPFKSFDHIYSTLDSGKSYFNICDPKVQDYSRCDPALKFISRSVLQKSAQNCILNRKHTSVLIENPIYLEWFKDVPSADEHCYITYLFHRGLEGELMTTPNIAFATTFVNWSDYDYKYKCDYSNKNYSSVSKEELLYLLESPSFFGRKFMRECLVDFTCSEYLSCIRHKG